MTLAGTRPACGLPVATASPGAAAGSVTAGPLGAPGGSCGIGPGIVAETSVGLATGHAAGTWTADGTFSGTPAVLVGTHSVADTGAAETPSGGSGAPAGGAWLPAQWYTWV